MAVYIIILYPILSLLYVFCHQLSKIQIWLSHLPHFKNASWLFIVHKIKFMPLTIAFKVLHNLILAFLGLCFTKHFRTYKLPWPLLPSLVLAIWGLLIVPELFVNFFLLLLPFLQVEIFKAQIRLGCL